MAAPRNRPHLFVESAPTADPYRPHARAIIPKDFPRPQNRKAHARSLRNELKAAREEVDGARESVDVEVAGAKPGYYIEFESPPDVELKLESLENRRSGIELVAVRSRRKNNQSV